MAPRPLRLFGGASLLLAIISCSSDNNSTGPSAGTTFPPAMMGIFGSTGETIGDFGASAVNFGGTNIGLTPGVLRAPPATTAGIVDHLNRLSALTSLGAKTVAFFASPTCTPTVIGGGTDTDGDGIPDDMTTTYTSANCTVTDTATGSVQLIRGTIRYRDTNDDLYGFQLTLTGLRVEQLDGTTHQWARQLLDGSESATTTTTNGTWALKITGQALQGTADTVQTDQVAVYNVTGTYTPGVGPIPAGGPIPDGTFTLAGTLEATVPPWGRLVTQIVTTTPLTYTDACGGDVSGKVEMRLNGSTEEGMLIRWLACHETRYEFLGSGVL